MNIQEEFCKCKQGTAVQLHNYSISTQHNIQADERILHSYVHIQEHKHAHTTGNSLHPTSTTLSKNIELSVQQLIYKTLSKITSPMLQNIHHQLRHKNTHHSTDTSSN